MTTIFTDGERVDIAIRGARIAAQFEFNGADVLRLDLGDDELEIALVDGVTATRVCPENWPPQPGDVWADGNGSEWFARLGGRSDPTLYLTSARTGYVSESPDDILALDGPMRLVYRAGQTTRAGDPDLAPEVLAVATPRSGDDFTPAGEEVGGSAGVSEPPTAPADGPGGAA